MRQLRLHQRERARGPFVNDAFDPRVRKSPPDCRCTHCTSLTFPACDTGWKRVAFRCGISGRAALGHRRHRGRDAQRRDPYRLHDQRSRSSSASGASTILTVELTAPAWRPMCTRSGHFGISECTRKIKTLYFLFVCIWSKGMHSVHASHNAYWYF